MKDQLKILFFLLLMLISNNDILAKWGGGGGFERGGEFGNRGSSAARANSSMGSDEGWFGGGGYYRNFLFTNSGMGSRSRSDAFKNMVLGAAAGYLAYHDGKRVIRSISTPMMWNNRRYYWGSQYHPDSGNQSGRTMCRMPIDSSDPQFRNVYTLEGSRPKEIVWSCRMSECCCGSECCPDGYSDGGNGNGGGSRWNSSTSILLSFTLFAWIFIIY